MKNIETAEVSRLREHVARFASDILANPNRTEARNVLSRVVRQIPGFNLERQALEIELPGYSAVKVVDGALKQVTTTKEESDAQFQHILDEAEDALNQIEAFQQRVQSNASLPLDASRKLVLKKVAEYDRAHHDQYVSSGMLQWELGLSGRQVEDAITHLQDNLAIEAIESRALSGSSWQVKITHVGRDMDAGSAPTFASTTMAGPTINIGVLGNVHNPGNIQAGNDNVAHVTQTVQIDNRSIEMAVQTIREHLSEFPEEERAEVGDHLATVEEELHARNPDQSRLKTNLKAIGRIAREVGKDAIEAIVAGVIKGMSG